jgi:arginase
MSAYRMLGFREPKNSAPLLLSTLSRVIELIGIPFDYCGYRYGTRLGPAAVRLAGLVETLGSLGKDVNDIGDLRIEPESTEKDGIRNFAPALSVYRDAANAVDSAIANGRLPLVIGGDHSISIGTVSGALRHGSDDLAVLWIDAHTDLNIPETSPSGNLHGMVVSGLFGARSKWDRLAGKQWNDMVDELIADHPLKERNMGWFAVRDVDPGEKQIFRKLDEGYMATMSDIDRHGVVEMTQRLDQWLRHHGVKRLWISFDVDSLDPFLAPGTGTAVRGGLSYREMHVLGELMYELLGAADCPYRLAGLELVETNPLYDTNNETAKTAVEWIGSLFGKSILGMKMH